MVNTSQISIVGNLTGDPELNFTASGAAVANFTIAVQERVKGANNEYVDGEASFYRCAAWRSLGEHVAETLKKGDRAIVIGSILVRKYEDREGVKGTSVDIDVEHVGPDLRFATATVTKAARSGGGQPAAAANNNSWGAQPAGQPADDPWATQPPAQPAAAATPAAQPAAAQPTGTPATPGQTTAPW